MTAAGPRTVLAFDYGRRRIGVAAGQELTRTATALDTLPAQDGVPDWKAVDRLIETWRPAALVVGLPVNMDDTEHALAPRVRDFGSALQQRYNLPVHFADERLTSWEAEQLIKASGRRLGAKNKESVDRLAAQLLLQAWLNEQT